MAATVSPDTKFYATHTCVYMYATLGTVPFRSVRGVTCVRYFTFSGQNTRSFHVDVRVFSLCAHLTSVFT
jgi:hypothetical protein